MSVTRSDVVAALTVHDPAELAAVLEAAGVSRGDASSSAQLAEAIATALWWNHTTPIGYAADRTRFEDIVLGVAGRLGVAHRVSAETDAWSQLSALTHALFQTLPDQGVSLADLDPASRERIQPSWSPTVALGLGSGGSVGTAWASGKALGLLRGPLGRLLPLIPPVAPYYKAIVSGLGVVRIVAWPLGVALAVLSLDQALGRSDRRLVPLLLGVGALGPVGVQEAEVVGA